MTALLGILTECKKGEDDPFISLRRRKARVVGSWKLTSGTKAETSSSTNSSSTDNYTYTESTYNYTGSYTSGGTTSNSSNAGVYSVKVEFKKDGTFTHTEIMDSDITITSGTWNFTHGVGEYKNKEQILLTVNSAIQNGVATTITGNGAITTLTLKELRNKKMVITVDESTTSTNSTSTNKEETVLEQ